MFEARTLLVLVLGLVLASGCSPPVQAAPPSRPVVSTHSGKPTTDDRSIYRLDFVLAVTDGGGAPNQTSFTMNLSEHETGEVLVGKNVLLAQPPPGSSTMAAARQDVGTKVKAFFRSAGDDIFLQTNIELSASDPPTIHKLIAVGGALASPGKSALVSLVDDQHRRIQLDVTPTKLR